MLNQILIFFFSPPLVPHVLYFGFAQHYTYVTE